MTFMECDASGFVTLAEGMAQRLAERELPLAMRRIGSRARDIAQSMAPVDTSRLRNSIAMATGRDGSTFWAQIGTNVEYGPYVEYGTGRQGSSMYVDSSGAVHDTPGLAFRGDWQGMGPMPYVRPAVYDFADLYREMVMDAVRRSAR